MSLFSKDIAIDLGTSTVLVVIKGKGVALREPAVVAVDKTTGELLKVGVDAYKMLGRTPGNIAAVRPVRDGAIADYEMTEKMLKEFLRKVINFTMFKPRILICVPSGISEVEERAVIDAGMAAGARRVFLLEEPMAAALGAGMDISGADGHMVVDIGAGTTNVAVLSMNGVVEAESIKTAGDSFDEAIVRYIRKKYNTLVGERTAEELKMSIGCVYRRPEELRTRVKGRCLITGMPRELDISSTEIMEALDESKERILEAVRTVLESTPPELVADISRNGMVLTGGGSLLWGFDQLIRQRTGIDAHVADDADTCVSYGLGRRLEELDDMQDGTLNFSRRRQIKHRGAAAL
ncbi:MAG: rod shape-determining protein [Oscillospiraceae bacterium]|nr:rod shape-determining protein [Oscillospiraceae bacterium]